MPSPPGARARRSRRCTACRRGARRGRERVDHRVVDGRRRADRPGLADPLGAERVARASASPSRSPPSAAARRPTGRRSRRGCPSAGCRPRRRRTPRRAPARRPVAMPPCTWPSASSGLMSVPASSTRDEPLELDLPGLDVDLDDGDVGAERERRRRLELVLRLQLAEPARRRRRARRAPPTRATGSASRRRGSGRGRCRARRRPRSPRGSRPTSCFALLDDRRRRRLWRPCRRSAATSSRTCRCPAAIVVGVALDDRDLLDREPEPLGRDHREGRLVPLAVRERAGVHDRAAVGGDLDLAVLAPRRAGS